MPANIILDTQVTFVTDPVSPTPGQDFSVSWQEKNIGDEDANGYQVIFDMSDSGSGDTKTATFDLAAGDSQYRTISGWNLPAGNYYMSLVINAQNFNLGNVIIQ
jgi:hypothetical protein